MKTLPGVLQDGDAGGVLHSLDKRTDADELRFMATETNCAMGALEGGRILVHGAVYSKCILDTNGLEQSWAIMGNQQSWQS